MTVPTTMRAVVYHEYGSPDVLSYGDLDIPVIKDDEVLLRVLATSINSWDWDLLTGTPFHSRIGAMRRPRYSVLGADVAGRVELVGKDVTRFKPGDEVFGDLSASGWGGFAEFASAKEKALALKPASLTFEQAAAVPQAAVLALQGLRDKKDIQPGDKVLINGAGGGTGTFAIQIAKSYGAEVTAVDAGAKLDIMRSVGADHVIDYTQDDFTANADTYDLILDVVANRSMRAYKRSLTAKGVCVVVGGKTRTILGTVFLGGRKVVILVHRPNAGDLAILGQMVEAGTIEPIIDSTFKLEDAVAALRSFGEGGVRGKIVITP
jgi:NADPH:quinone reductase-like Zn-dependent oxidoreductase